MFRNPSTTAVFLLVSGVGLAQAPRQSGTLTVSGYSGEIPVVRMNDASYVDLTALAKLTGGSLNFKGTQTVLTLPAPPARSGFSQGFVRAAIEEMTVIREWRTAIVNAVRNNFAVMEEWVAGYRRTAESKLTLASAAAATDSDRNALGLLTNELGNMQKFSDNYVALHKSLTYTSPSDMDNDALSRQILDCAQGLASLAAGGQFEDVPACR